MAKNFTKSKRAISPILATLLLIVIAVAAIVVTYAWIMTYMASTTQQAGVRLFKSNVRFYGSGAAVEIAIGNSGTAGTEILEVYAGTSPSGLEVQTTSPILPATLAESKILYVSFSYNWTAGETYYFKIVSSSGQILDFPEQAPSS